MCSSVWYVQTYAMGVYVDSKNLLANAVSPLDAEYAPLSLCHNAMYQRKSIHP